MANEIVQYSIPDIKTMADAIAKSQLFGIKNSDQALALMLIASAEGRHPVEAARDYNIIEGKPSKTAEAMLRDFLSQGGKVEWHTLNDLKADATFSHPAGGSLRIDWDMARAKAAGIGGKAMWTKYPRQMLRSRVISEGVRSVCPAATSGMYVPEEVKDFDEKPMKDVTPPSAAPMVDDVRESMEKMEATKADEYISYFAEANMEDLQKEWKVAQKQFKDSKEFARLHAAKEKRKKELLSEATGGDEIPPFLKSATGE